MHSTPMPAGVSRQLCLASVALFVAAGAGGGARADVLWNEPVNGDFSDDRFAPTPLSLNPGSNELFGVMAGGDGEIFDRDYFSIVIPDGHVLAQINLGVYISVDFRAFIAIQPGPIFPNDPDTVEPEDLLGWTHFGPNEVGFDLLEIIGSNGQGFTPPLPAGTYTFWAQQSDDYTDYALDFIVDVPAPGGVLVFAGTLPLLARRRRG